MANDTLIQPRDATATPVAPEPVAAPSAPVEPAATEQSGGLSEDLLRIPALQGIFAGQPAAVSAVLADFQKRPEAQVIIQHLKPLNEHGIALYRSLDGALGVIFNQLKISAEQIKQADAAGTLAQVAPPWDDVTQIVGQSGENNPALTAPPPSGAPNVPPAAPQIATAPAPVGKGPPASVQKKTQTARLAASQPGAPTSGPKPGSGRLLNNILRPVV